MSNALHAAEGLEVVPDHVPSHWPVITTPKVLVVEDDSDCRISLSVLLERWGYDALTEADGSAALESITAEEPAVVLLDLGLPSMHGLKLLHEIRAQSLSPRVIIVTAAASPEVEARAHAMGAVCVMSKPIDHSRLQELLQELLPAPDRDC